MYIKKPQKMGLFYVMTLSGLHLPAGESHVNGTQTNKIIDDFSQHGITKDSCYKVEVEQTNQAPVKTPDDNEC